MHEYCDLHRTKIASLIIHVVESYRILKSGTVASSSSFDDLALVKTAIPGNRSKNGNSGYSISNNIVGLSTAIPENRSRNGNSRYSISNAISDSWTPPQHATLQLVHCGTYHTH